MGWGRPEIKTALISGGPLAVVMIIGLIMLSVAVMGRGDERVAMAQQTVDPSLQQLATDLYRQSQTVADSAAVGQVLAAGGGEHAGSAGALSDLLAATFFDAVTILGASGHPIQTIGPAADTTIDISTVTAGRVLVKAGYTGGLHLGRPIMRDGMVQGVALFHLSPQQLETRLAPLTSPRIGLALQAPDGEVMATVPFAAPSGNWAISEPMSVGNTGWRYLILTDERAWAKGWPLVLGWLGLVLLGGITQVIVWRRQPMAVTPSVVATAAIPQAEGPGESSDSHPPTRVNLDDDAAYRIDIVAVMTLALDCWQVSRHKGKVELAEESGLWRVYMDRSSLQTRTLDKYLLIETLPRHPRWRDVVRTAEFVQRHCTEPTAEREALSQALARLKQHLRRVAPTA